MTLIIGLKCKDGIVLGADGAATMGGLGQQTIRQSVKKLTIISGTVVVGVAGPVGLGQRLTGVITDMWAEKKFAGTGPGQVMKSYMAMTHLRHEMGKHCMQEMEFAGHAAKLIGQHAQQSALATAVVALPLGSAAHLFQFDQQCSPEEATEKLPFVAHGSGQMIADPFLAFLRHIFWSDKQPNLAEGIFSVLWTLVHAIRTHPGGVADPKQIVTLKQGSKNWEAKELTEANYEEHYQAIEVAEQTLARFRETMQGSNTGGVTPPPSPPKSTS